MKSAVIVGNQPAPNGGKANTENQATQTPQIPFTRASMEHQEPFLDSSIQMATTGTVVAGGPIDVPAYGFLSGLVLFVKGTLGTAGGTSAVAKEDAPWSCIQDITLQDVNGAPIIILTGFDLYMCHKYGGYSFQGNPITIPYFSAMDTGGNFAFAVRLPVQVGRRDALGSLPNNNASSTYKLRITQAPTTSVFGTSPGGVLPTLRWRAFLEAWAQPPSQGIGGGVNAVQPPALGTTQFWTESQITVSAGYNRVRLPRVGNLARNIIFIARATSDGLRATGETAFPTDWSLEWDSHVMFQISSDLNKLYTAERFGYSTIDNGVRVIDLTHDFTGHPGDAEYRDLWIPTTQSSRLELVGNFGAGVALTMLVNDVAPVGQVFL